MEETLSRVQTYGKRKEQKKRRSATSFPWLSMGIVIVAALLVAGGLTLTHITDVSWWWNSPRTVERFWINAGQVAVPIACIAFSIWVIKTLLQKLKRNGLQVQWLVKTFQVVRKQHILLGTLTMLLGVVHGVYFMFHPLDSPIHTYTGLLTFVLMFVLGGLGIMYKFKTIDVNRARKLHLVLGFAFGIAFAIHVL